MSIKRLFKYLSNKVCKLSPGCSYWVEGRGEVLQPQLSEEQSNAKGSQQHGYSWEASRLGLQCELKLTLRSAPHNDPKKTADKRVYFVAGQRGS